MTERTEQRPGERILLWFLAAFSIFILITALTIPRLENLSSSGAFPIFIASVMILSTLCILWKNRARYSAFKIGEEFKRGVRLVLPRTVTVFTAILVVYILLLYPLHFWASSYLFLIGSFLFLKGARLVRSLTIAAGMLAVIYLVFQYIFKVILW